MAKIIFTRYFWLIIRAIVFTVEVNRSLSIFVKLLSKVLNIFMMLLVNVYSNFVFDSFGF